MYPGSLVVRGDREGAPKLWSRYRTAVSIKGTLFRPADRGEGGPVGAGVRRCARFKFVISLCLLCYRWFRLYYSRQPQLKIPSEGWLAL